jgi:hypothetical protein
MVSLARLQRESELTPIEVDWRLAFTQPATNKGLFYWRTICGGRSMPSRRDLSPRAMRDFLTHANVVDVIQDSLHFFDYVVSLQSQHACEVLGNVAGRRLGDIMSEALAQRWRSCFDLSRSAAVPVRLVTRASTQARNWLACEALLAPLGDGESVQALFWVFAAWRAE